MQELDQTIGNLVNALLSVDRLTARKLLTGSSERWGAVSTVEELVTPALELIGAGWENGNVALSQVYMSSLICEELLPAILPPEAPPVRNQAKIAIAVLEDHHQLGKRMVYSVLRASGFDLLDYGHGVKADSLVDRAITDGVKILLISTLMLPSALMVRDVRLRLNELGGNVRIVVGGAPFLFDDRLWQEVGADAMGRSATDAIRIVTTLKELEEKEGSRP